MSTLRDKAWLPVLLGLTACAAIMGFAATFSYHAVYDDEGALISPLRRFLAGEPLYDGIATIYGPLYYFYEWAVHRLLGIAITHESARFVSLAFWIAASVLLFLFVHRLTRGLLLSAVTIVIGFRLLGFIGSEPAHPQELCVLLLMLAVMAACLPMGRTMRMMLLGSLAGAMLASKVNLGIFAAAALAIAFVTAAPPNGLVRTARLALYAAALMLPIVLMRAHLADSWGQVYCAVVGLSIAAVLVLLPSVRLAWHIGWRDILWASLGCLGMVSAGCGFALVHGSALPAIFRMLVIAPSSTFVRFWYVASRIPAVFAVWAAAALWLAWRARDGRIAPRWIALLKIGLGAGTAVFSAAISSHALLGFALPLQWLVLLPAEHGATSRLGAFGRIVLATLSVLESLYGYPVASVQIRLASLLPLAVGAVCFADGFAFARSRWPERFSVRTLQALGAACWILLAAGFVYRAWATVDQYRSFEPLGFPGTRYLRLPQQQAATLKQLVGAVSANCQTLVSVPSLLSVNLWTGVHEFDTPGGQIWMLAMDDIDQRRKARELSTIPGACAIYAPELAGFWTNGVDISNRPLVKYIREDFHPIRTVDGYQLLRR